MITKIAVIGQQCSGKTSAAKIFRRHFDDGYIIKIADPIYDTLNALRKDKHRAFMQQFADLAKLHFGEQVLVEVFKENVKDLERQHGNRFDNVLIACDDIRFPYELDTVHELGFYLVGIDASREVRMARAEKLGLDFIENHNSETLVPQLFQHCNFMIKDNGMNLDELFIHCNNILNEIVKPDILQPIS